MFKLQPLIAAIGIAGFGLAVPQFAHAFMNEAAQANYAEIAAANIALERASDPAVKDYARQMVNDHTRLQTQLKQLAQKMKVALVDQPSVMYRSKLALLRATQPQAFDRQYMEDFGRQSHRITVEQYRLELQNGKTPEVQAFLRQTLPMLEQHMQQAMDMHGGVERRNPQAMSMPDYGRAALGVGVQGGQSVLVTRKGDSFSNPLFYNIGGLSMGAQAGAAVGPVALLLMTDKAVKDFKASKNFSNSADAGLNIFNYSARKQGSVGKIQDVIVWSGAAGAYAGVPIGLNGVAFDDEANRAYYGRNNLDAVRIIDGSVEAPGNNVLGRVLAV